MEDDMNAPEHHDHEDGKACPCCPELEIDADDMAIASLCGGVGSLCLALFSFHLWPHFLALPLGLGALGAGLQAIKLGTKYEKQALAGMVCGTAGLAIWLVGLAARAVRHVLGG